MINGKMKEVVERIFTGDETATYISVAVKLTLVS
jgi:hypothetical protein